MENGPKYLLDGKEKWPVNNGISRKEDKRDDELKGKYFVIVASNHSDIVDNITNRSSMHPKIRRKLAWMVKSVNNIRLKQLRRINYWSSYSEKVFFGKICLLESSKLISKSSELLSIK